MPEIPSIGPGAVGPINRAAGVSSASSTKRMRAHTNGVATKDRVELSSHARLLDRLHQLPDIRQDLIDRVRREIAAGRYDTPEKVDAAIRQLLDEIG